LIVPLALHLVLALTHPPPPYTNTLSLHDALPIFRIEHWSGCVECGVKLAEPKGEHHGCAAKPHYFEQNPRPSRRTCLEHRCAGGDRKSTRLNSSHQIISYAVFCLKKKKHSKSANT